MPAPDVQQHDRDASDEPSQKRQRQGIEDSGCTSDVLVVDARMKQLQGEEEALIHMESGI